MKKFLIIIAALLFNVSAFAQWGVLLSASRNSSAAFTPASISGLVLWLKADQITGLSDGDPVSTWLDQSGVGNDGTSSGSNRPIYKTNIQNSLPAVRFITTPTWIRGVISVTGTTVSVFVVSTLNSGSANFGRFVSLAATSTNDFNDTKYAAALLRDGSNQGLAAYRNSELSVKSIPAYATAFSAASVFDGTNQTTYVNNVATGSPQASSGSFTISAYSLGENLGASSGALSGDIFEVCVYTGALSSTDRANLLAYAQSKWGTP